MSSASKVGEVFTAAGIAFTKLGELTMQLHTPSVGESTKWTEEDVALLQTCLTKFANEIDEITSRVKLRAMTHINSSIKKKEYEDASLSYNNSSALMTPPPSMSSSAASSTASSHSHHHTTSSKANRRASKKLSGSSHHQHHSSSSSSSSSQSSVPQQAALLSPSIPPPHSQEVTLNMLNASDASDADLKMDFDSPSG